MKITESKLRKMIRKVLKEFTPSARALGARTKMRKGEKSAAFKSADADFKSAQTAYTSAEKAADVARGSIDSAEKSVSSAKSTLDTKSADLEKHIKNEPTGDKKETTQYSYTNTATGNKTISSNDPGTVGGWESGGKTEYSYTNTVTNKKVTGTSDPGTVGDYIIPAIAAAAELKVTSTHFFSADEIKSKATKVKGAKEMITQIQSDLDKWTKFEKDNIETLPKGFKDVVNNMKAAQTALDNLKGWTRF